MQAACLGLPGGLPACQPARLPVCLAGLHGSVLTVVTGHSPLMAVRLYW
jgi:hypothetical protein